MPIGRIWSITEVPPHCGAREYGHSISRRASRGPSPAISSPNDSLATRPRYGNLPVTAAAQPWLRACETALVALAMSYAIIAWIALRARRVAVPGESAPVPPTTILKPLCGEEFGLYERLRTFCGQHCTNLQIVFGVL